MMPSMLQLPLPPDLALATHPVYGNVLVAAKSFSPGDPVILESPLMYTDEDDKEGTCDQVYEAHQALGIQALVDGRDASLDFGQQILAYLAASPEARALVRIMCSPCKVQCVHRQYIDAAQHYTHTLQRLYNDAGMRPKVEQTVLGPAAAACATPQGAQDMATLLLVWACNSYAWVNSGCALLAGGSLVTHSCRENTRFHVMEDGLGARALLARAPGRHNGFPAQTTAQGSHGHMMQQPQVQEISTNSDEDSAATALLEGHDNQQVDSKRVARSEAEQACCSGSSSPPAPLQAHLEPPRGCFLAVKHIAPGDVITTTYLGYGVFRIMSTRMRRAVLRQTKMFTCTCARCMDEPDWFGALPCPRCRLEHRGSSTVCQTDVNETAPYDRGSSADGFQVPQSHHHQSDTRPSETQPHQSHASCCRGYILRDGRADNRPAATPWTCDGCGSRFSHAQVAQSLTAQAQAGSLHADLCKPSTSGSTPLSLSRTPSQPGLASAQQLGVVDSPPRLLREHDHASSLHDGTNSSSSSSSMTPAATAPALAAFDDDVLDGLELDAHMEARVHNLNSMLAAGVQVTAAELLAQRREAAQLYGFRHWTVHALGLGLVEVLADELVEACHAHLDAWADSQSTGVEAVQHEGGAPAVQQQEARLKGQPSQESHNRVEVHCQHESDTDSNASTASQSGAHGSSQLELRNPRALVSQLCDLMDETWHYLSQHTKENAAAVMRGALGPATTALLAAAESGLLGEDDAVARGAVVQQGGVQTRDEQPWKARECKDSLSATGTSPAAGAAGSACTTHHPLPGSVIQDVERAQLGLRQRALQVAARHSRELDVMFCQEPWLDLCSSAGVEAARVAARCKQLLGVMHG